MSANTAMEMAEDNKLPESQFTPESFDDMVELAKDKGIVAKGGQIYGKDKYEQLDPGWIFNGIEQISTNLIITDHYKL